METHKIIVGYCRSASARDGDTSAVDEQKRKLEYFAKKYNFVIARFYVDVGVSGVTLERPALKQLISDCEVGKVQMVLVADLERIARNTTLLISALDKFQNLGIQVLCINKNGRGFFEILRGAAEELKP